MLINVLFQNIVLFYFTLYLVLYLRAKSELTLYIKWIKDSEVRALLTNTRICWANNKLQIFNFSFIVRSARACICKQNTHDSLSIQHKYSVLKVVVYIAGVVKWQQNSV